MAVATCAVVTVVTVAALPVTLIPQEPDAPVPVFVGASSAICATTYAVVATWVVLVFTAAVGATGVPVSVGLVRLLLVSVAVAVRSAVIAASA